MSALLQKNTAEAARVFDALAALGGPVERAAESLAAALLAGRKLLACGNGGSAADAAHLTTEFVCRFDQDRRPYPALCLASQGGDLTAIGNDYAFADVFSRQVDAFGQPGDVLFVFSSSGNSENVRRALDMAKAKNVRTVALLGKTGGSCAGLAEIELLVRHDVTARIQEAHVLLLHTICERVEERLAAGVSCPGGK